MNQGFPMTLNELLHITNAFVMWIKSNSGLAFDDEIGMMITFQTTKKKKKRINQVTLKEHGGGLKYDQLNINRVMVLFGFLQFFLILWRMILQN